MHACLSKPADFSVVKTFTPDFSIIPEGFYHSAYARALRNTKILYWNGARIGASANPENWSRVIDWSTSGHISYIKGCDIVHDNNHSVESISMKNMPLLRDALRSGLMVDRARIFYYGKAPRHIVQIREED